LEEEEKERIRKEKEEQERRIVEERDKIIGDYFKKLKAKGMTNLIGKAHHVIQKAITVKN